MPRNELGRILLLALSLAWPWCVGAQAAAKVTLGDLLSGQRPPALTSTQVAPIQIGSGQPGSARGEAAPGLASEVLGVYGTEAKRRVVLRHHDTTYPGLLLGEVTPLGRLVKIDGLCAEFKRTGLVNNGQRLCLNPESFYAQSGANDSGAAPVYTEYSLPTPPAGSAPVAVPNVLAVLPVATGGTGGTGAVAPEAAAAPSAPAVGGLAPNPASGKP
ncbi:MAG: hypothetical protein RIT26_1655 [Pseudomonadota bacterium]